MPDLACTPAPERLAAPPKRLLILVPGDVGDRMSAPAIRAWSLAQALSATHRVTAAVEGELPRRHPADLRIVKATRPRLLFETLRHDVVLAACQPPFMLAAARARGLMTVADHYDPVEQELVTLDGIERRLTTLRALRRLHHAHADVVLCASEAQRRLLATELRLVARGEEAGPAVGIVPYGLSSPPPRTAARPLRDAFPEIRESDKIVLWWGKIWRWFDAETALRAFASFADSRPDIKLVITAGPPPSSNTEGLSAERGARTLAEELGLLGRSVFFLEEWLPYEARHHCLHEADLGLTLHADTPEATLAARARYMDYAWASLPCVLAKGDEVANEFARAGFARLVTPGDTEQVAQAIIQMLDSPCLLQSARAAGARVAKRYQWPALAQEISRLINTTPASRATTRDLGRLAAATGAYYLRRALDVVHDQAKATTQVGNTRGSLRHATGA